MRSKTSTWFECKVRYEQMQENGNQKMVAEQYVVDALSFTEAENRLMEAMESYISGEFEIAEIKKAPYREVFFMKSSSTRQNSLSSPSTRRQKRKNATMCITFAKPVLSTMRSTTSMR